jgi:hypothetical protein
MAVTANPAFAVGQTRPRRRVAARRRFSAARWRLRTGPSTRGDLGRTLDGLAAEEVALAAQPLFVLEAPPLEALTVGAFALRSLAFDPRAPLPVGPLAL